MEPMNPPPHAIECSTRGNHSTHGVELRHRVSHGTKGRTHPVIMGAVWYGITEEDREACAARIVQAYNALSPLRQALHAVLPLAKSYLASLPEASYRSADGIAARVAIDNASAFLAKLDREA